jgi:hypothetical protein
MRAMLFTFLMVSALGGLALSVYLQHVLRRHHEQTWIALGRPSLVLNNTITNGFAVLRFLWRKDYLELDDPRLTRLCTFILFYQVGYVALFIVTIFFGQRT